MFGKSSYSGSVSDSVQTSLGKCACSYCVQPPQSSWTYGLFLAHGWRWIVLQRRLQNHLLLWRKCFYLPQIFKTRVEMTTVTSSVQKHHSAKHRLWVLVKQKSALLSLPLLCFDVTLQEWYWICVCFLPFKLFLAIKDAPTPTLKGGCISFFPSVWWDGMGF